MSTVFCGAGHGFSVRGDRSVKEVQVAQKRAFHGAVGWFTDYILHWFYLLLERHNVTGLGRAYIRWTSWLNKTQLHLPLFLRFNP